MTATSTQRLVLTALLTALVAVVTFFVRVPIGAGYFNFSDAAVYIAAFLLGPLGGFIAGGVGPALADLAAGYAAFAPLTFLAHGLQGLAAGHLALRATRRSRIGGAAQALTEWPFNLLQNVGGALVAIPLAELVQRAYPMRALR